MANYAVIQGIDVVNIIEWDGQTPYDSDGQLILADENAHIGGTYIDGVFSPLPGPTPEGLIESCKSIASQLLYETDWTTIADVADPTYTPYLMNQEEFKQYRAIIRGYAVNPIENPVWPTPPTEEWSS